MSKRHVTGCLITANIDERSFVPQAVSTEKVKRSSYDVKGGDRLILDALSSVATTADAIDNKELALIARIPS